MTVSDCRTASKLKEIENVGNFHKLETRLVSPGVSGVGRGQVEPAGEGLLRGGDRAGEHLAGTAGDTVHQAGVEGAGQRLGDQAGVGL